MSMAWRMMQSRIMYASMLEIVSTSTCMSMTMTMTITRMRVLMSVRRVSVVV